MGLAQSDYGLVVISKAFIEKRWPEYELSGLNAKAIYSTKKIILPIWYNISHDEVLGFSPTLADKFAINADGLRIVQIAVRIIEAIRPDVLKQIQRRISWHINASHAVIKNIDVKTIKKGPIIHESLPKDIVGRIRLIRAALMDVYPHTMAFWLDGFQRDAHPSREIAIWEHISACWREFLVLETEKISREFVKNAFNYLVGLSISTKADECTSLSKETIRALEEIWRSALPPYDFEMNDVDKRDSDVSEENLPEYLSRIDTERFPEDLPEELIRQLLALERESSAP